MKQLIAFTLGQTQSGLVCGGGMRFLSAMDNLSDWDRTLVTTEHWLSTHQGKFPMKAVLVHDNTQSVAIAYLIRSFKSLFVPLKTSGPTIVYSPDDFLPDVLRPFLLRRTRKNVRWVQVIFHLYIHPLKRPGHFLNALLGYLGQRFTHLLIQHGADLIICDNPLLVEHLVRTGVARERIMSSNCGIDLSEIAPVPPSSAKTDCCYIGRINQLKGVDRLVECFLKPPLNQYSLMLIGAGPDLELLKKKAVQQKSKNLVFAGSIAGPERFSYLKSSHVFVFMSHEEGWGIVIAEALACGAVPVVWDLPVYRAVFPTEAVVKIKENDFAAFEAAVQHLLTHEAERTRLAKIGFEFVKRYDWKLVMGEEKQKLEALLEEAKDG